MRVSVHTTLRPLVLLLLVADIFLEIYFRRKLFCYHFSLFLEFKSVRTL